MSARPPRLLVLSYVYAPSVGGIERVSAMLVDGFRAAGWEVRVVTRTAGDDADPGVLRRPTAGRLLRALRSSDAIIQTNVSVALAWPLIARIVRRPWIVVNHTPIADPSTRRRRLRDRLKVATLPRGRTYVVSDYLRRVDSPRAGVVPNPFDERIFTSEGRAPTRDLLFVGRVVVAKGLDVLVAALGLLQADGRRVALTVVGDGPERPAVEAEAARIGLDVRFLGALPPEQVAEQLRAHRVLAVPSRPTPPEAFGLVAIEGIACGCTVIGTDDGGLPEAIGPCGTIVPSEDAPALAAAIRDRLAAGGDVDEAVRTAHLDRFRLGRVVETYTDALVAAGFARPAR